MNHVEFIARWKDSAAAELANSQSFLKELCALLEVPQPDPTQQDESANLYVFEKQVAFNNGDGTTSGGRIDLYRSGCFVLESKQGAERKAAELAEALATTTRQRRFRTGTAQRGTPGWEQAMIRARQQAKRYAEALPNEWPPFLIVADVGHCFDVYADFSQSGKNYVPFPDPQSYRIPLAKLADDEVREQLRAIWLDPHTLDPTRRSAKVTREVADRLARLAKSLELQHSPDVVAGFLMRCLFTMFAEDVEIGGLKKGCFSDFLKARRGQLASFVPMLSKLWDEMNTGGFSVILAGQLKQFNGGLFANHSALPVTDDQLELLIEAAGFKWNDVEPAIFGTLLERALDAVERHKLGAHYTPRAYVERLVMPTIIEPLRDEWDTVYATAATLYESGKTTEAVAAVRDFHNRLCGTRVLDPACGSGNFLYVAMELMKRLEGEVVKALRAFGDRQKIALSIDPHQFLGIEVNPRAAAIADLVLWIGYLQWHFRTNEDELSEPIIRNFHNIENRDAVLSWDSIEPVYDNAGNPVTRWDGRTTKRHPVTGEEVPDETAQVQELRYLNPRKAEWPVADFIVGNPPFIGNKKMREALGDGYVQAVRFANSDAPDSVDFVMYWWNIAASKTASTKLRRFGLITTNSITQSFNSRLIASHLADEKPISLLFAVPDHPWVDATDGASVRIAMTVAKAGKAIKGRLSEVISDEKSDSHDVIVKTTVGTITPQLTVGVDISRIVRLNANRGLACPGVQFSGQGFIVSPNDIRNFPANERRALIRPYITGRDLTQICREQYAIDAFGLDEGKLRNGYPAAYQWLYDRVRPERLHNPRESYRQKWWLYSEPRMKFRNSLVGLSRVVVTSRTARHRTFQFLPPHTICETKVLVVAIDDAFLLGVMSSRSHVVFANLTGGWLGVGNDSTYNHSTCFDGFPFPCCSGAKQARIRELGEQLDAHRKKQQSLHPTLTFTGMYNVLEKLRSGEELTAREREIHDKGLVSVLMQFHDELDAAVFDAYGWPHNLSDEQILERLVVLNQERAAEEARGRVRWLRPEFQKPAGQQATQTQFEADDAEESEITTAPVKAKKQPWPATLPERISAVRHALNQSAGPVTAADVAKLFTRARKELVEELLDTLVAVGQARETEPGRYAP